MITHVEAETKFKRCRDKERGYKLAANTRLQRRGRAFAVKLYETDVVIIRPDGTYRINSGGWRTAMTRNRMDMVLPCCISPHKGIWCIGDRFYTDGILIGSDGQVIGQTTSMAKALVLKNRVDKCCNKFAKIVTEACVGRDIGCFEGYKRHALPRLSNTSNLAKLWNDITETTKPDSTVQYNVSRFFALIYLTVLDSKSVASASIWQIMRNDCLRDIKSRWIQKSLMLFLRPRKPLIVDMIINLYKDQ